MIRAIALALCLAAPLSTSAQTLDEIVARHLEARGGLDRLHAIRTVRIVAREPNQGVSDETLALVVIVEEKRPNLTRTTTLSQGTRIADYEELVRSNKGDSNPLAADQAVISNTQIRRTLGSDASDTVAKRVLAFDGSSYWGWDWSRSEARKLPRPSGPDFGIESEIVDYVVKGSRVELTGQAQAAGHACYTLRVTSREGVVRDVFIDAQTYLEVAVDYQPEDGTRGWRKTYDHWKVVNGIRVPHTITIVENSRTYLRRIDKVEFDVPIDDGRFAMPAGAR